MTAKAINSCYLQGKAPAVEMLRAAAGIVLTVIAVGTHAENGPKPVTVAPIEELYIYPSKDAPAMVVSLNDAKVSAEATGVIKSFAIDVGDRVDAGQLIASLNCEEHEINAEISAAGLEATKSKLAFARTQLASAKKLSSSKGIAQEQVDERQSEYAVAAAEIDRAQAALKNTLRLVANCRIEAPFSGIVAERLASVGDYAAAGTPIVRLIDTVNIEISANVQEQDLPSLEEAKQLFFFNRRDHFPAEIRTVMPVMDGRLRSFEVRLAFPDKKPVPGTTGRLQWKSPWPHVPSEFIVRRGEQLGLFLLSEGIAHFASMDDAKLGRPVRVDLPSDIQVILDGRYGVQDGDRVAVANPGKG